MINAIAGNKYFSFQIEIYTVTKYVVYVQPINFLPFFLSFLFPIPSSCISSQISEIWKKLQSWVLWISLKLSLQFTSFPLILISSSYKKVVEAKGDKR